MSHIHAIGGLASPGTLREFANQSLRRADRASQVPVEDRLEISSLATFLNRLAELPEDRARKVVAVRGAIDRGGYETDEKLDIATERLLKHL